MTHAAPDPGPDLSKAPVFDPDGPYDVDADGGIDGGIDVATVYVPEPERPKEPVALSNVAQVIIAALVYTGWVLPDSPIIGIVGTVVGLVAFISILIKARSKVTPL